MKISNKPKITELKDVSISNTNSILLQYRLSTSDEETEEYQKIDISEASLRQEYKMKYEYWKRENLKYSFININNVHIKDIAFNEMSYLPFMLEDLSNGDTDLVRVLELIFPDKISYGNLASKEKARKEWLKILPKLITI